MKRIYKDNSQSIGNTPLIKLSNITRGAGATVLAKIEGRNPAYPAIHEKTTGPEIWNDTEGEVAVIVSGVGFIPDTLDLSIVDRVEQVDSAEAGEFAGRNIIVILPDAGERYLSTVLFEG
ncbi:MAG: hypothetical protein ACQET7_14260, partial [Thermodesulfobacteriota bacterium]